MTPRTESVTAFAPGGVGNIGPGLDILGLALAGAGDTVRAEWTDRPGSRSSTRAIPISPAIRPATPRGWRRARCWIAAGPVAIRAGIALTCRRVCRSPAARAEAPHRPSRARWR